MRTKLFYIFLLIYGVGFSQSSKIKVEIDTTNIRIGEQFQYKISVDETENVIIPKLSNLKGLEVVDTLKIDRSFVENLQLNHRSQGVVKTILELCSSFKASCIVEGVETAEQKDLLLSLGCRNMQGYYFCRPTLIENLKLDEMTN